MRIKTLFKLISLVCAASMALLSCGYRISGTGSLLPEGTHTLAVTTFINATNEPYVDSAVTKAVTDEFIADGRLRVTSVESADVALRGRVVKYQVTALSYTPDSFVQQYKVTIVVEATLEERKDRKVLWREGGIESVFIAEYPVSIGDVNATKIAKEAAIQKASQDIAWTLRSRVLEGF